MFGKAELTFIGLIFVLSSQSWAQGQSTTNSMKGTKTTSKFAAEWRLVLSGTDNRDLQSQSKIVDIRTDINAKYLLSDSLNLDIQPTLRLQSGQSQSVNGADKPDSKITLNQAALHFSPISQLKTSLGALNQKYIHTGLTLDPIAFPAARIEAMVKSGNLLSSLTFESAIPTSTSLSTNTKELEATPSLNSVSLTFDWKISKNHYWKTQAGYFIFGNLPSTVAQESGLLGNDVTKLSESDYRFLHEYEGYEASTHFKFPLMTLIDITGGAEYVINQKAPEELNTAYRYLVGAEFHFNSNVTVGVQGSYFSVAPEATVAYFNAGSFETNRIGYSIENFISFKKAAFKFGYKYTDSEVMFTNPVQSREKTILIVLETFYANI